MRPNKIIKCENLVDQLTNKRWNASTYSGKVQPV